MEIVGQFIDAIREAGAQQKALNIEGSGSKKFYGGVPAGTVLSTLAYTGIIDYDPQELVLTARAGTPLAEIQSSLAEAGQMLVFEPPRFGSGATLGGCVAAGLSGPRRPYLGAVRDAILGVRILDGRARDLRFGGRVIKNVAGYDASRLMTGAMGTLGLLLDISLKVHPLPASELTIAFDMNEEQAISQLNRWAGRALPLSASCFYEGRAYIRLSGAASAVTQAHQTLGGDEAPNGDRFWLDIREHTHAFFNLKNEETLWRISLPSTAPALTLPGRQLIEWGGALRWLISTTAAEDIRSPVAALGGHATAFRGAKPASPFHPLSPGLLALHQRLKAVFDPNGVFNRGRLYAEF